jgi:hypothetical protein
VNAFAIIPVLVVLIFAAVLVVIVVQVSRNVAEWADNNSKPVLSAPARVVAKRSATSGNVSPNAGGHVSTAYYATFELASGERQEFLIRGDQYGMLAEDDAGTLTYQGTRYHGFERGRG